MEEDNIKDLQETIKKMESFLIELQTKHQETRDNILFLKGKLEGKLEGLKETNANRTTKKSVQA